MKITLVTGSFLLHWVGKRPIKFDTLGLKNPET